MAEGHAVDTTWMWHPSFSEQVPGTAGLFVDFRRRLDIPRGSTLPTSLSMTITADTRYKLWVNSQNVSYGPVKGDRVQWFFDEVDIAPFLRPGCNIITVRVLRFFFANQYATSFPRLPTGGLRITTTDPESPWRLALQSSRDWECAVDTSVTLRTDEAEDDFLHVYERAVARGPDERSWVAAQSLEFQTSTGNTTPWNLAPRGIPKARTEPVQVSAVHNVQSAIQQQEWASFLTGSPQQAAKLHLVAGSSHQFDIEVAVHTTGFIKFNFDRPRAAGATLRVRYAESYEDKPRLIPYLRTKGDRRDTSRGLYGPEDFLEFEGPMATSWPQLGDAAVEDESLQAVLAALESEENYEPFHWRTFRFVRVTIDAGPVDLEFRGINIESTRYPLDISAQFCIDNITKRNSLTGGLSATATEQLWTTSIRTLNNCMHDCYEDCPFYEQLQYAMDTRSSCLFTYYLSADDRLARQAITQLHNSFNPLLGLTASRAPSHRTQYIPHFSLHWICMLGDHLAFTGDASFARPMLPVADAVLDHFQRLVDPALGLVRVDDRPGLWHFTDWVDEWRPYGIPPDAERTGFSTYTSSLYAFALRRAASLVHTLGRPGIAEEYLSRANDVAKAIAVHCFDGAFFTDGLAGISQVDAKNKSASLTQQPGPLYSQHNQVWAVLSGAAALAAGSEDVTVFSQKLLRSTLDGAGMSSPVPSPVLPVAMSSSPVLSAAPSSLPELDTSTPLSSSCPSPLASHSDCPDLSGDTCLTTSAAEDTERKQKQAPRFIPTSISMSHYTFRALSQVGGTLYDDYFSAQQGMWEPWVSQLEQNLTTWEEDGVSQRSDCHAWGSTPVYEFLAEVAGLRPTAMAGNAAAGWVAGVSFAPRTRLFKKLDASVPLRRRYSGTSAEAHNVEKVGSVVDLVVHVSWDEVERGEPSKPASKLVRLTLENSGAPVDIPLSIKLPGQPEQSMTLSAGQLEFHWSEMEE